MEPTNQFSELTQAASGFLQSNGWIIYMLVGILVITIAYFVFQSLQPSANKALSKAKPKFQTYEQVTKLAPLGCPTPADFKLCDYYIASSSYSVFPGAEVYDYVSDQILPLIIKAGARLVELDIYADINDKPVVGLKNQKL